MTFAELSSLCIAGVSLYHCNVMTLNLTALFVLVCFIWDGIVYTLYLCLTQVLYGWRKVTREFLKRLDPDLPFYYHTSAHTRFYEDIMPDFSVPASKPRKIQRAPQRELLGATERVSLSVRGSGSIRATFHNVPVDLPPPPGAPNQFLAEHSYFIS